MRKQRNFANDGLKDVPIFAVDDLRHLEKKQVLSCKETLAKTSYALNYNIYSYTQKEN